MSVAAIQSGLTTLLNTTPTVRSSGGASMPTGDPAAIFERTQAITNTFLSNTYSSLGQQAAVNQALARAQERQNEEKQAVIDSAVDALDAHKFDEAREIAREMLKEDGQSAVAAHILGRADLAEGDYDAAEKNFSRASMLAPSSSRFASDLNVVRQLKKPEAEAIEHAAKLISQPYQRSEGMRLLAYLAERNPDSDEAHMLLGDALMDEGQLAEAVTSYRNALVASDENTLSQLVERFTGLVEQAPDAGVSHSLLGQALQKQGQYGEALVHLQRAADIAPENRSYHHALAAVQSDMGYEALEAGRSADAIRYFEEAYAIDPSEESYQKGLAEAHLDMAQWWQSRGVNRKAFDELNSAKVYVPEDDDKLAGELSRAFNRLGDRYMADDELDWAISSYKRAHELDTSNLIYRHELSGAYEQRGTGFFDAGDYEMAELDYQAALDLFPSSDRLADLVQAAQDAQA